MNNPRYYLVHRYTKPAGARLVSGRSGRAVHSEGYIQVQAWDHPFCNHMGYVMEHRLVWETYHRAILLPWANVHHINEIKTDNRPENLQAMMIGEHTRRHGTDMNMEKRRCSLCGRKTYLRNNGRNEWYLDKTDKTKFNCRNCHRRLEYAKK
jgi:HNH endonuclease